MAIASYIIVNFLLIATHLLLAHKWLRPRGRSMTEVAVAAALSAVAQLVVTMVALGLLLRWLRAPELFWVNIALCAVLLAVFRIRPGDLPKLMGDIFRWIRGFTGLLKGDAVLIILTIVIVMLLLWLLFFGVLIPPYAWDALVYHLGAVGSWMQSGYLSQNAGNVERPMNTYPRNVELLFFWNIVFLKSDTIVNCTQFFFIPLGMMAAYLIARRTGRRRRTALYAGLLFAAFPAVIQQADTCYVDLASNILFLMGLAFLLRPRIEFSDIVYGTLGLGLFLGAKGNAPYFAAGAIVPLIIYHIPHLWRRVGLKRVTGWLVTGIVMILLTGSWAYASNWIKYGNPAYPYIIEFNGKAVFHGFRTMGHLEEAHLLKEQFEPMQEMSPLKRVYYSWSEPVGYYAYDLRVGGFGPIFFVLLMPCMAASLLISVLRRDGRMFFTIAVFLLSFWAFPHARHWVRMHMFVGVGFAVSLAYLIDLMRMSRAVHLLRMSALFLALMTIFLGSANHSMAPAVFDYYLSSPPSMWHSSQYISDGYELQVFRKAYEVAKPGTSIAYDSSFKYWFLYPLWNRDFSNRAYFLEYSGELMWKRAIDDWEIDFLITGTDSKVYKWAEERPNKFEQLVKGGNLSLFRVIRDEGQTAGTEQTSNEQTPEDGDASQND